MDLPSDITWHCRPFDALSSTLLYEIMALRNAVFIVEQNCPYQDLDGMDLMAFHLMGLKQGKPVAYARILPPVAHKTPSIGRVIVSEDFRQQGLGHQLIRVAMAETRQRFDQKTITISAQYQLKAFYQQHGFKVDGDTYLEDNIPHIRMIYTTP